jgi:hypothetical protein
MAYRLKIPPEKRRALHYAPIQKQNNAITKTLIDITNYTGPTHTEKEADRNRHGARRDKRHASETEQRNKQTGRT